MYLFEVCLIINKISDKIFPRFLVFKKKKKTRITRNLLQEIRGTRFNEEIFLSLYRINLFQEETIPDLPFLEDTIAFVTSHRLS